MTVPDLDGLYRTLAVRLERIVRRDVQASEAVIEDACQFAWSRLITQGEAVERESVLAWLARTAVREAFKLVRRQGRDLPLEQEGGEWEAVSYPGPEETVELRTRLTGLGELTLRQQRMVWLHAAGMSYREIALQCECTTRTVERQLLRAKQRMRGW